MLPNIRSRFSAKDLLATFAFLPVVASAAISDEVHDFTKIVLLNEGAPASAMGTELMNKKLLLLETTDFTAQLDELTELFASSPAGLSASVLQNYLRTTRRWRAKLLGEIH